MLRYQQSLKGTNVYTDSVSKSLPCEGGFCTHSADFTIRGDRFDDDLKHVCKNHLEVKEYVIQGRCDECRRSSFEPWLCLVSIGGPTLYQLCKKCHRVKRRMKNV